MTAGPQDQVWGGVRLIMPGIAMKHDNLVPIYADPQRDLLEEFGQHKNLELSYRYGEEGEDGAWQVHRVNGGRNDREWTLIGGGDTPSQAIDLALAAIKEKPHG